MVIFFPWVTLTKGDWSGCPTASRPKVRAHWTQFLAVTTPSSRRPSSGCACGKASTPPSIFPTFAASTHDTLPAKKRLPSTFTVALAGRTARFLIPVTT